MSSSISKPREENNHPPSQTDADDPEELKRFREAWKAELRTRKGPESSNTGSHNAARDGHSSDRPANTNALKPPGPASGLSRPPATAPRIQPVHGNNDSVLRGRLGAALADYRLAVQCEERRELDRALVLYRRAFQADPNVDRAYYLDEERRLQEVTATTAQDVLVSSPSSEAKATEDTLSKKLGRLSVNAAPRHTGTLASLVGNFPDDPVFEPENEDEGVPISKIPDEMLVVILRMLDHGSIEHFGAVCRKARVITLDASLWRDFVEAIYRPPQVISNEAVIAALEQYNYDYREMYQKQPRIRLDGVYIAVCHYIRPGLSENAWVNINHLITYHRYLRFLPDGTVLSLLANEESDPHQIVPQLQPSLRMKGLFIGAWALHGTTISITGLTDASGKYPVPPYPLTAASFFPEDASTVLGEADDAVSVADTTATLAQGEDLPKYTFQMTLSLYGRPTARWNRLDLVSYESIGLDGDVVPVALKHERGFWFSRVRSWL